MTTFFKNAAFFFLLFFFCVSAGFSQDGNSNKGNDRKLFRLQRKADIYFYNGDFLSALALYQKAYITDTTDASLTFKIASSLYYLRKYMQSSLPYFEKALRGGVQEANYYLGKMYHFNGKFDEAIYFFEEYKKVSAKKNFSDAETDILINKCRTAKEMVRTPLNVKIENIGGVINSVYPDYVPLISADESVLIFTSRREGSTGKHLDPNGDYFEDIYISRKKDGQWTNPLPISPNINTPTHDACAGLSPDGDALFLYRTSKNLLSGDLYISVFNDTDWTLPRKLPPPINMAGYTEPSVSMVPEGQVLYFSSDRPGGYGKKDIYRIVYIGKGQWSKVHNLGPAVNTPEDEDAPFIHPDGKTLYFSSKAHENMGGYDIFKTVYSKTGFLSDEVWSQPENLGYPVNTQDDDIYFTLSTNGNTGYYSSYKPGGFGSTDIYLIHFAENFFGLNVLKGKVISADTAGAPLNAKITLKIVSEDNYTPIDSALAFFNADTSRPEGIYHSNQLTGKFMLILTEGKKYLMKVESDGYLPYVSNLEALRPQEINLIKLHRAEE